MDTHEPYSTLRTSLHGFHKPVLFPKQKTAVQHTCLLVLFRDFLKALIDHDAGRNFHTWPLHILGTILLQVLLFVDAHT